MTIIVVTTCANWPRDRRGVPRYPGVMRAVTIIDGDLAWNEHPDPTPGPGEVVVAVTAAGINGADLLQRKGFYPAPTPMTTTWALWARNGRTASTPGAPTSAREMSSGPNAPTWSGRSTSSPPTART